MTNSYCLGCVGHKGNTGPCRTCQNNKNRFDCYTSLVDLYIGKCNSCMEKLGKARQNYQIMMETSAPPDKQTVKFMDKNTRIFGLMTHDAGKDISEKEAFEDVEIMEDAAGWHAIAKVLK